LFHDLSEEKKHTKKNLYNGSTKKLKQNELKNKLKEVENFDWEIWEVNVFHTHAHQTLKSTREPMKLIYRRKKSQGVIF